MREGDARALPMADASAALVLSSPPYAGTYDYAAMHDARFLWLGLSPKKFRRVQLGARSQHVGRRLGRAWRAEQARFMAEIARVLRPGGRALLVVGDGVVDGRAENAPDGIAAARRGGRPRAGGARLAGAAGARSPAGARSSASARAASTCCCCRRASRSAPALEKPNVVDRHVDDCSCSRRRPRP